MLKTQLHSKLSQLSPYWQDSEDILTGDFFGILDYLPRNPYLHDFLKSVEHLNDKGGRFELDRVDWENVDMLFWQRCPGHDDSTEPDVVLVSNRWVIVVEVKLGSGFGESQPWREYQFGQQMAKNRYLAHDTVHYVIVSRAILNGEQVFDGLSAHQRSELEPRTLWFRWLDAVTLVDGWRRRHDAGERQTAKNESRMLKDLIGALRRRRTLSFCGFSFTYHPPVHESRPPIFCPPLFKGFLCKELLKCDSPPSIGFLASFQGFVRETCPSVVPMESVWLRRFWGFVCSAEQANAPSGSIFCSCGFDGFANDAPQCVASATMIRLHKGVFRERYSAVVPMESVWLRRFRGFVCSAEQANAPSGSIFCSRGFKGS